MDSNKLLGRKRGKWFEYYIEVLGNSVENFLAEYPPGYQRTKLKKTIENRESYQLWLRRNDTSNTSYCVKGPRSLIRDNLKNKAQASGVEIGASSAPLREKVKSKIKKKATVAKVKTVTKNTVKKVKPADKRREPLSRITKPVAVEIF